MSPAMPIWIIAAALASIAITGGLTLLLWRMNASMLEHAKRDGGHNADHGADDGGSGHGGGK